MDYKILFDKFEKSIRKNIFISESEFSARLQPFLEVDFRKKSDKEIFWVLVYVNFYSGIKAVTIEKKLDSIKKELFDYEKLSELNDEEKQSVISKIGFQNKCNYCFSNARTYKELIKKFGSFEKYVNSLGIIGLDPDEYKINKLRDNLREKFYGLGPRTVNHFLTDLGFNVLKPDRVICRIFYRLGLIGSTEDINGAIREGKKFEVATGKPIRYIDITFVKYGQMGKSERFGIKDGICLEKNPNCKMCEAKDSCKYYKEKMEPTSLHF